ncbi:MAG: glycosyltransferase family 39 protein, partial [Gammaproteobacteria bacterium]
MNTSDTWLTRINATTPARRALWFAALFVLAVVLFAPGIGQVTSVTTKDEYYLGLRTPMCMVEQDHWLIPCLDNEPRIKKPPLLYWITAASYDVFGVSLTSARIVAVLFAALFVLATALIAWEMRRDLHYSLLAGLIMLSTASIAIGARMLLLDIPTAALSALALYFALRWRNGAGPAALMLAAVATAAGFLVKGPIALVLVGSGALALLLMEEDLRKRVARHWPWIAIAAALFLLLALPWYVYVHQALGGASTATLQHELKARDFFDFSLRPIGGLVELSLPWTFLALFLAWPRQSESLEPDLSRYVKLLLVWLLISFLPFLLIKTFGRYLYASLVPLSLISATLLYRPGLRFVRVASVAGWLVASLVIWLLLGMLWWFHGVNAASIVTLIIWLGYTVYWWRVRDGSTLAASSALLWLATMGALYPGLGFNAIPADVVSAARGKPVVMYDGPQPALLPSVLGRELIHLDSRWLLPDRLQNECNPFLLFAEDDKLDSVKAQLAINGLSARQEISYPVLTSRV